MMMRNDFSQLERIFKMAVGFVPAYVLIECQKLLVPYSEDLLSADERTAAASRVVNELMELKGYLRFGVYTETIRAKDCCTQDSEEDKQFLIREFSLAEEDLNEKDDEHICSVCNRPRVLGFASMLHSDGSIHFRQGAFRR